MKPEMQELLLDELENSLIEIESAAATLVLYGDRIRNLIEKIENAVTDNTY